MFLLLHLSTINSFVVALLLILFAQVISSGRWNSKSSSSFVPDTESQLLNYWAGRLRCMPQGEISTITQSIIQPSRGPIVDVVHPSSHRSENSGETGLSHGSGRAQFIKASGQRSALAAELWKCEYGEVTHYGKQRIGELCPRASDMKCGTRAERGCTDGHAGAARPTVRAGGMQGCRTGASWR